MEIVIVLTVCMIVVVVVVGPIIASRRSKQSKQSNRHFDEKAMSQVVKQFVNQSLALSSSFYTKVVGVTFDNKEGQPIQSILPTLSSGMRLDFIREPENKYDINAICVVCNGKCIGYLSRDVAAELSTQIDNGEIKAYGEIKNITGGNGENYGCNIEVHIIDENS